MRNRLAAACGTVLAALLPIALTPAPASAAAPSPVPVVTGLDDPYSLQFTGGNTAMVAENGTGEVTRVNTATGATRTLLSGAAGVAAATQRDGRLYVAIGGPDEQGPPAAGKYAPTSVLSARADGTGVRVLADLERYELRHNPDGQVQFVDGKPVDALSNPFAIAAYRYGVLVADGGGNDVLRIDPATGRVSTFFVPPTVRSGACKGAPNNPGTTGCDAVPTGVTVRNGSVYVSTLGAEAPGAGRVYRLNARTGAVQRVWRGLTAPTGIAVTTDETLYLSELLHGTPAEGPGPGFDPASVGRITRIAPGGRRTHAAVTLPIGVQLHAGRLYATSWSVAGAFLGAPGRGQVVRVSPYAFR